MEFNGMNLIDLMEMICDWKAASERHADGHIHRSLKIKPGAVWISEQLAQILENTVEFLSRRPWRVLND
jgi:hypothetical protein